MKKVIQITITEACNLNCIYCYEKNKDFSIMDLELAKSIIEKCFLNAREGDFLEFDFHGGEIALAFDRIKEICEWTWSKAWNNDYVFHATTNGTLIHGDIKNWFLSNSHKFSLGLSLDGTREMHNINRCASYDDIDLDFFLSSWPSQTVKMTISPQTISEVDKGIIHLIQKGFDVSANLAYGQKWKGKELRVSYLRALSNLVDFYLRNPELKVCNIVNSGLNEIGKRFILNMPNYHRKWCGTGDDMQCYSIFGQELPCQMFNPSSNQQDNANNNVTYDFSHIAIKGCEDCILLPSCPSCYGYSYIINHEISKCPDELCDFRKIEFLASSYLYGQMLLDPSKYSLTRNLNDKQIACIIIGIKMIQDEFCHEF